MDIFSTPFFGAKITNHEEINQKLINFTYEYQKEHPSQSISNRGGYHTDLIHKEAIFSEFFDSAKTSINKIINSMNAKSVSVLGAWINVNNQHAYNTEHNHPECDLAAVYYIKTPKNCGRIYMNNPVPQAFMNQKLRKTKMNIYSQHIYFDITEGALFVFPGWLFHGVEANNSDEDRISMAFNLQINNFSE